MSEPSRDQQIQAVLHSYLQAVDAGQTPDREEIFRRHPAFAAELREFFADQARMDGLAQSLHRGHDLAGAVTLGVDEAAGAVPPSLKYIGDYELQEEIARGGMGVVFQARQVSLHRTVAVKMILKGELANEADAQRFRHEAEAAANLDHPNIVPIYEIGEHEGQQYFSMKLIGPGRRRADLGAKETVRITALVARAVHHAHQRGILHRDLKPGNILFDAHGEPHVADFGLAKRVGGDSGATRTGAIVGTPSYMAPEQARADKGLTTAVDVYSLGAILYEWLTGRPPFRGDDVLATLSLVANEEPPRPRTLDPRIDRDLETICLKCLAKDPLRRYGSAELLAEDLERRSRGEPILARPTSRPERLLKWARRRPERAVLYGLAVLVLALGLVWTARQGWLAWEQVIADREKIAEEQRRAAEQVVMQKNIERHEQRQRAQFDLIQGRDICLGKSTFGTDVGMFQLVRGLREAVAAEDNDLEAELRLELGRYAPLLPRLVAMYWNDGAGIVQQYNVSLSRDGKRLVAAGARWGSRVFDVDGGRVLGPPFADSEKAPWPGFAAISPDGSQFVNDFGLSDAATGKLLHKIEGIGQYNQFAPDGKRLLAVTGPVFLLLDPATGGAVGKPLDKGARQPAAFSPDGSSIAFLRSKGENKYADVRLWDAVNGEAREPILPAAGVRALAFSPDSKVLATAGWENEIQNRGGNATDNKWLVRLWNVETGKPRGEPLPLPWSTWEISLAFSPDGKRLLTAGNNGGAQLWDLEAGKPLWREPRFIDSPLLVSFHPDGKTFWTFTKSGLSQWDAASGRFLAAVANQCNNPLVGWAASADGRRVAVLGGRYETFYQPWGGMRGGQSGHTILVWELPLARPGDREAPRPLAGSPEQIGLWLQAQTGREMVAREPVTNMSFEVWWECRKKLSAAGGLAMP